MGSFCHPNQASRTLRIRTCALDAAPAYCFLSSEAALAIAGDMRESSSAGSAGGNAAMASSDNHSAGCILYKTGSESSVAPRFPFYHKQKKPPLMNQRACDGLGHTCPGSLANMANLWRGGGSGGGGGGSRRAWGQGGQEGKRGKGETSEGAAS